ncbi:GNAT family N-acetyltransferase [Terrimonas ferruginea]|uniref:GNAT family N-acetyltransferase n=1 Tax=Terrimonas ferruginea TaxID=249 RepID=UPI0004283503|nr:GNAT family N-acetyltransferase [Terrimonas ferruginea]
MEILFQQDGTKGSFYIDGDGNEPLAELTFSMAGTDKMILDHTGVTDALRGKNAGAAMVAKAVEYARANNIRIIPLCPFARAQFDKHPEYNDTRS